MPQPRINVIIVNNNELQSKFLEALLDKNKYNVFNYFDEQESYDFLLNFEDLSAIVVVSYMFKNGSGLSLIKRLIEQAKQYAFVFLSSDNTIERVVEALQIGAIDFVSKTFQLEDNFEPVIKRAYENQLLKIQKNELEKAIDIKNKELARLSIVASETINIVFIYSKYFELEWVNRSFVELYGYSKEEFIDKFGTHIFGHSVSDKIQNIIEDCSTNKRPVTYTNQITSKLGEELWLQTTINPVILHNGDIEQYVVIETDITDIKRSERKIIQQQKKIDESLNYAERIQKSILPENKLIHEFFPNSFVYFLPAEKVSGDLPFFYNRKDSVFIATIDCTGHGIPGAFLTFVVHSNLVNIIDSGFDSPAEILLMLNLKLNNILHKYADNYSSTFEDLEIGLCTVTKKNILFAGIGHRLFMYQNNSLQILKLDSKLMISNHAIKNQQLKIKDFELSYSKGDKIFMFSDGLTDMLNFVDFSRRFGSSRVKQFFEEHINDSIEKIEKDLIEEIVQWKGEGASVDDILVMGFEL